MYSAYKVKIMSYYENSKIMKMTFMRQLDTETVPSYISEGKFDFAFVLSDVYGNLYNFPDYF
jgi:hypothetical protein